MRSSVRRTPRPGGSPGRARRTARRCSPSARRRDAAGWDAASSRRAGRGSISRWCCAPGFPPPIRRSSPRRAAVATARAISRAAGVEVGVKWVNDLYYAGKKLCGILAEAPLGADGRPEFVVIGIGVNVLDASFPPELSGVATSLEAAGAGEADRAALAAAVIAEMARPLRRARGADFPRGIPRALLCARPAGDAGAGRGTPGGLRRRDRRRRAAAGQDARRELRGDRRGGDQPAGRLRVTARGLRRDRENGRAIRRKPATDREKSV